MELNFENREIMSVNKLFEGSQEQSVDIEIALPDYHAEVSKILTCCSSVSIQNKQCIGESVTVGGQVQVNILYLDPDGELNSYICQQPFTKAIDTKTDIDEADVDITTRVNYLNHKATAPRRLELHGSLTLNVKVTKLIPETVLLSADSDELFTKKTEIGCVEPMQRIRKLTYVEDEITTGNDPAIAKLIRTKCTAEISECKFLNQKAMIKGDLFIELVYLSSDCRKFTLNRQQGFSQIIDCDNVDENTVCTANADVMSFETRIKATQEGENRAVSFEAKIDIELKCSNHKQIQAVCDAFSNVCRVNTDSKRISLVKSTERIVESFVCKKSYELPDCGGEMVDNWCDLDSAYSATDSGKLIIKGTVNIAALYVSASGDKNFYNKPIDFEYTRENCEENEEYHTSVKIKALSCTLGADGMLNVEIEIEVVIIKDTVETVELLSKLECKEDESISKDEKTAVILYFAENETVWDVAKKYNTSPEKICAINCVEDINSECCKVLLVPNC